MTKQSVSGNNAAAHPIALAAGLPTPAAFYQAFFAMIAVDGLAQTGIARLAALHHWPLAALRQMYPTLGHAVAGFSSWVTQRMTDDVRSDADATLRDQYFELFMARLDALQPYRQGFLRFLSELPGRPDLAAILLRQSREVTGAMMEIGGWSGPLWQQPLHQAGLVALYARLLQEWRKDASPDLAKTMAFLDEQLAKTANYLQFWRIGS